MLSGCTLILRRRSRAKRPEAQHVHCSATLAAAYHTRKDAARIAGTPLRRFYRKSGGNGLKRAASTRSLHTQRRGYRSAGGAAAY